MPKLGVDGVNIYYDSFGSGAKILILAHAYPTNRMMWQPQVDALAQDWTVVAYDARGFGLADAPDLAEAYSPTQSVADLLALLDHLRAERVDICGLSMGGNIALNFALAYPHRVNSLVVSGTGAGSDDATQFGATTNAWADAAQHGGMQAFADLIAAHPIFAEYSDRGSIEKERLRKLILSNSVAGVAHTARQVLAKRHTINALAPRLRELTTRTLVVIGEKDTACVAPAQVMKASIPEARLAVIPETGHFNNIEEPTLFNQLLISFLSNRS